MHYHFSDLILASESPLPELTAAPDCDAEVTIEWPRVGPPAPGPVFQAWLTPSGGEWLTFAEAGNGFLLTFAGHSQFHVSRDASAVQVHPSPDTPAATTRHLLLNQVLPLVLSRRGRLVLHASAVSWHGRVAAFIGKSGAGKSTMAAACAAAGATVVTDDCLVVRRNGTGDHASWLAVPCDAGVRLFPETLDLLGWSRSSGTDLAHFTDKRRVGGQHPSLKFETNVLPLAHMYRLTRPDEPERPGALRGRAAVMSLASELFRLDVRDPRESRRQFDAITALASGVAIDALVRQDPAMAAAAVLCRM